MHSNVTVVVVTSHLSAGCVRNYTLQLITYGTAVLADRGTDYCTALHSTHTTAVESLCFVKVTLDTWSYAAEPCTIEIRDRVHVGQELLHVAAAS